MSENLITENENASVAEDKSASESAMTAEAAAALGGRITYIIEEFHLRFPSLYFVV